MSLNAHYIILFKNPRDASQFANLARQMYPKQWQFAATREPYSYLLLDLRPEQNEDLRLRTNVFPGETHYVYVPKKNERANETVSAYAEKNTQNGREGEARVREKM